MSFWKVNWKKTVDRYEGRSHKFLKASRRLNILSSDMLSYMHLCEVVASLARDGHIIQVEFDSELIRISKIKDKREQVASTHKLHAYNKQLSSIHKTLSLRTKELEKVRKKYQEHLDTFADAIK
jgi:hypothetical protein